MTDKTTHNALQASREKLSQLLHEVYGDSGYVVYESQPKDRFWRFSTGIGFSKSTRTLAVRVQVNRQEWDSKTISGQPFDQYTSLIPKTVDEIPVEVAILGLVTAHADAD